MNRASSYFLSNGVMMNAGDLRQFRPSGAFVSTVSDLMIWNASLRSATLLSQQSLDRMATPVRLIDGDVKPYGFGWFVLQNTRFTVLYHAGG
jgi:hypothetical protein